MKAIKYIAIFSVVFLLSQSNYAQNQIIKLEDVKSLALKNNKQIKMSGYDLEAAKAAQKAAKTINKPSIDASATGTYIDNPPMGLIPEQTLFGSVGLTQVIYAGGKVNTANKMATAAVDLQTSKSSLTDSEVLLNAETTYWQAVSLKSKVELAEEYQNLLKALLKDLTNLHEAGMIYKNDLLEVQVEANQAELNLTTAQDYLQILKMSLAQQIGLDSVNFDIESTLTEKANPIEQKGISEALEVRPEIEMLSKAVEIQDLQTSLLKANRRPSLGLSLSSGYVLGENINAAEAEDYLNYTMAAVSLNIPIFDWGGRKQKVKEQEYKVEAQKLTLLETKEMISIEIENAYLALNRAIKNVEISNKSVIQAQENLKLNEDRFSAGTVNGSDVLEAQVLWQKAKSNLINAQAEYNISKATYLKAIGALN